MEKEFNSLEDIRKYFYSKREELYISTIDLAEALEKPMFYLLFIEAIDLYERYGYPEIFEYLADTYEWVARKIEKEIPNILDYYSYYGKALLLRKLADVLKNNCNYCDNIDLNKFQKTIEELYKIDGVIKGYSAFQEYIIRNPERGYKLFSRLLRILKYIGTVFVCELMAILTNSKCKVISKLYEVYSKITINAHLIRWMSKEYISKIPHLKYVHKRMFDAIRRIVEISNAIDSLLYYLERGGKFASRNLQSGPT